MPASRVQGTLYNRCPKVTQNYYSFSRKAGVRIGVYRQLKRKALNEIPDRIGLPPSAPEPAERLVAASGRMCLTR